MRSFEVPADNYFCVVSGNQIKKIDCNKKPVLRECLKFAKKGFYSELWYCYTDGSQLLIDFWN